MNNIRLSETAREELRDDAQRILEDSQSSVQTLTRALGRAERRIVDKTGRGIVSFISNFEWLSGLSHTGMRERFLEVGQGRFVVAQHSLSRAHLIQAERQATLLTDAPPDGKRFLFVAQAFLGLAQHVVGNSHEVQAGSLLFLIIHLNCQSIGAVQGVETALSVTALDGYTPQLKGCRDILRIRG